jgi:hypothetical protein
MVQVVRYLSSKFKALSSNPSTTEEKRERERERERDGQNEGKVGKESGASLEFLCNSSPGATCKAWEEKVQEILRVTFPFYLSFPTLFFYST